MISSAPPRLTGAASRKSGGHSIWTSPRPPEAARPRLDAPAGIWWRLGLEWRLGIWEGRRGSGPGLAPAVRPPPPPHPVGLWWVREGLGPRTAAVCREGSWPRCSLPHPCFSMSPRAPQAGLGTLPTQRPHFLSSNPEEILLQMCSPQCVCLESSDMLQGRGDSQHLLAPDATREAQASGVETKPDLVPMVSRSGQVTGERQAHGPRPQPCGVHVPAGALCGPATGILLLPSTPWDALRGPKCPDQGHLWTPMGSKRQVQPL